MRAGSALELIPAALRAKIVILPVDVFPHFCRARHIDPAYGVFLQFVRLGLGAHAARFAGVSGWKRSATPLPIMPTTARTNVIRKMVMMR